MTKQERDIALLRYKKLVLATIDYLFKREAGRVICDDEDPVKSVFDNERLKAETHYNKRELAELKRQVHRLARALELQGDLGFEAYIREQTGESYDVLAGLRETIRKIIENGSISNRKELNAVTTWLHSAASVIESSEQQALYNLLKEYVQRVPPERKGGITITTVEYNNELEWRKAASQPRAIVPGKNERLIVSPGRRYRLLVHHSGNKKSGRYTYVTIFFPAGQTACIYAVKGYFPQINITWKDDTTVNIEPLAEAEPMEEHKIIRSRDDIVTVEYLR